MNYKEKYNQTIDSIKRIYDQADSYGRELMEKEFPELRESEDEMVRKELIELVRNHAVLSLSGKMVAWLEKQGEQKTEIKYVYPKLRIGDVIEPIKPNGFYRPVRVLSIEKKTKSYYCESDDKKSFSSIPIRCEDEYKLVEQKPTDKVEPKFKVGDWITNGYYTWKVTDIKSLDYILQSPNGDVVDDTISYVDENLHLWTIEDANDGDIVVNKSDGTIGMFQSIGHHPDGGSYNDPSYCFLHFRYDDGFFYADFENGNTMDSDDAIPAAEEQRDLLFQKMHEAGYEWDAEKKELKMIEKKPAWSEEDENMRQDIINGLKAQIQFVYAHDGQGKAQMNNRIDWLKSIKPNHWKPTENQMSMLLAVIHDGNNANSESCHNVLQSLYNDLKKL